MRDRQTEGEKKSIPDKEQDSEAPGVHSETITCGGRLSEDLRSEIRGRPTQCPHQHRLFQDPGLVKVCHLRGAPQRHIQYLNIQS